ncbi:MAG: 4Fe-4S dicluster domain-containing protein [Candidatus Thorarchaeota archaeon]|jgi:Fe-S-cluster-containing hydrogenase component 2
MAEPIAERQLLKNILAIDINKCTGCRNCELACSAVHTNTFNPKRSRIQVLKDEDKNLVLPMVCLQCEVPLCEQACPNGALVYNEKGTLYTKSKVCIGCANCVTACTFGGIEIDPITLKAIKCDLCWGDPACIKACEYGAISMIEAKSEGLKTRRVGTEPVYQTLGIQSGEIQE